jgi:dimethylaniline monooxygenase (N-oxide forming)
MIPVGEMQARLYCAVLSGKVTLPPPKDMIKEVNYKRRYVQKRYGNSPRHAVEIDWIPFLDELAILLNVKPNFSKLFFQDTKLWFNLIFGPSYTYQYRLSGHRSWNGARKAILEAEERTYSAMKTRACVKRVRDGSFSNGSSYAPPVILARLVASCEKMWPAFRTLIKFMLLLSFVSSMSSKYLSPQVKQRLASLVAIVKESATKMLKRYIER